MNIETRVEFLNAFNNTNFLIGNVGAGDIANTDQNTVTVSSRRSGRRATRTETFRQRTIRAGACSSSC